MIKKYIAVAFLGLVSVVGFSASAQAEEVHHHHHYTHHYHHHYTHHHHVG